MLVKRQHHNIRRSHLCTCPASLVLARFQSARKLSPLINCYVASRPEWQLANGDNRAPPTSQRTCLWAGDVIFYPGSDDWDRRLDYRISSRLASSRQVCQTRLASRSEDHGGANHGRRPSQCPHVLTLVPTKPDLGWDSRRRRSNRLFQMGELKATGVNIRSWCRVRGSPDGYWSESAGRGREAAAERGQHWQPSVLKSQLPTTR